MANGIEGTVYEDAKYAQLGERVTNISQRQTALESEMRRGFGELSQAVNLLSNELRGSSRTQWPVIWSAIGVSFTVLAAIGTLAYMPVSNAINRIDQTQQSYSQRIEDALKDTLSAGAFAEFKNTYENNRVVSRNDLNSRFEAMDRELAVTVPRAEHERVWGSYDQRFLDQQRQLDELKQAQGSVYGTRDLLLDMRNRIERVERDTGYRDTSPPMRQ
jgi:hypothetical protein